MIQQVRDPKSLLALTPTNFSILLSLSEGNRHAYKLRQEMDARSEGMQKAGNATLYRAIEYLLGEGLIVKTDERPAPEKDDARRSVYYAITSFGRKVVEAEVGRMDELVKEAIEKGVYKKTPSNGDSGLGNTSENDTSYAPKEQTSIENGSPCCDSRASYTCLQPKGLSTSIAHTMRHDTDSEQLPNLRHSSS